MTKIIERSYEFSERDVREALLAWLRTKDLPSPCYVGDTDTVKWEGPGEAIVRWTEREDVT